MIGMNTKGTCFRSLRLLICAAVILSIGIGCSGSSGPVSPDSPVTSLGHWASLETSHSLLWYGMVSVDQEAALVELIPARQTAGHLNVRRFVEEDPCTDCLNVTNFEFLPDNILSMDIVLTHPFPGLDQFTGFDVRGIVIFNGSEIWPETGVAVSRSELGDGELLNADGYTRLYNPVEFPPGSMGLPTWEYSQGKLAPDADLTATLNGYRAFRTDVPRRFFATTTPASEHFLIKRPDGPFVFGYAVDACWFPADPELSGDPYLIDVPDDFLLSANCPEAYSVSTSATLGLFDDGSGSAEILVDLYDWQHDAEFADVRVECPDVFDGQLSLLCDSTGLDHTRFKTAITNDLMVPEGYYSYIVEAIDWTDSLSPLPLVAYQFGAVSVAHYEPVIIPEPQLIVEITDTWHSPFCAKVDTQDHEAFVNSTQIAPVWDCTIRSISNDEFVAMAFPKMDMGAYMGLNVADRKLISPDFLTMSGRVEIYDLDDGSMDNFYVPIDPVIEVAFLSDGELFHDIPIAVVADCITARIIVFNYKMPTPMYHSVTTTVYPFVMEADYVGHRLFLYCFGGGPSGDVPTIEVFNADTWEIIASFPTDTGIAPFMSDIDYDPDLGRIYFGSGPDSFEVWDSETYEHIITVGTGIGEVCGVDHMGNALYVTCSDGTSGHLLVYDVGTFELVWDVPCGVSPACVACNPVMGKIYVPDGGGQSVFVFQ